MVSVFIPQLIYCYRMLNNRQNPLGGGYSRNQFTHTYENIISVENLLAAWREFIKGKRKKKDVQEFQYRLFDNIYDLHCNLKKGRYTHGGYQAFKINDPKPRDIHKASVRDRLLHHALYRILYPYFDRTFIADSYSCRVGKGTHRAMGAFKRYAFRESKNHTKTLWVLKCDIRKFFASIDQQVLLAILRRCLSDERTLGLLQNVIESFHSIAPGKGLPLGNLTSQLLVNIYMNEFDQFVKHTLKEKYYVRYADDFVILLSDKQRLLKILPYMEVFLHEHLKLEMHPKKVSIATLASGVDFLGWVHFPDHRILRTATKRRMLKRFETNPLKREVIASYTGLLSHGNARKLRAFVTREMG